MKTKQTVFIDTLTLRGTGVLRYMVFIKAYKGAFYLQENKTADQATDHRAARCLVLHYFQPIKAGDSVEATIDPVVKSQVFRWQSKKFKIKARKSRGMQRTLSYVKFRRDAAQLRYWTFYEAITIGMIKKNVSPDRFSTLLPEIEKFNALYRDITPGDRYTAVYTPESGTRLRFNDKLLGGIEGSSFAAAFFAIWVGENPIDESFRDRMLGRRQQ